ncbi:MAG: phosphonoacetaldehyde hydrolase [Desulfofustis sp. PB-SRB1]|nr:phosphonoacetaldehyde hydrolase [Desulfofustis sp. PB-SRB1]
MHNQDFSYTRTYRGPVKLVVFDWAGTAVDFGCQAPIIAFMEGFKQCGVEVTMEQARAPMGMEKRAHIGGGAGHGRGAALWRSVHGKNATDEDIDAMYEDFVPHLLRILPDYSALIPDVADAISALRANGVKIGATTGYFHEAAEVVVRAAAAAGYIPDAHLCASDLRQGRPSRPWYTALWSCSISIRPRPWSTSAIPWWISIPVSTAGFGVSAWPPPAMRPASVARSWRKWSRPGARPRSPRHGVA